MENVSRETLKKKKWRMFHVKHRKRKNGEYFTGNIEKEKMEK